MDDKTITHLFTELYSAYEDLAEPMERMFSLLQSSMELIGKIDDDDDDTDNGEIESKMKKRKHDNDDTKEKKKKKKRKSPDLSDKTCEGQFWNTPIVECTTPDLQVKGANWKGRHFICKQCRKAFNIMKKNLNPEK